MDATQVPKATIEKHIPHVYKTCLHRGIDIAKTPLEVAPGSHTWLGGLEIDRDGRTPVPGLWAAGETAGGIHGGNRIGGSALSASLVYGRRAGRAAAGEIAADTGRQRAAPIPAATIPREARAWIGGLMAREDGPLQADIRISCRMVAHEKLGPIRDAQGCGGAIADYEEIEAKDVPRMRLAEDARGSAKVLGPELESALSVRNLTLLGRLLATAALAREESRGAHYRLDFPDADDSAWRAVTRLVSGPDGAIELSTDPVAR